MLVSTSKLQHGPVSPRSGHHLPVCLQDKVAVDELPDAGDVEGDFWMHNAEVLVQMDAHNLESWYDPLEVHTRLVHHQLPHTHTNIVLTP